MKSSSDKNASGNPFLELTWMDLENWAGAKIVSRGKNYQRFGSVKELGITPNNELVAWVEGSARYATKVAIEHGKLSSTCTCPYGIDCKHGVAAVIDYLKSVKQKKPIPAIAESDERLAMIKEKITAGPKNSDDEGDDEYDDGDEESGDSRAVNQDNLEALIKGKSKAELKAMLFKVAQNHPQIFIELQSEFRIAPPSVAGMAQKLSKEIDLVSEEPAWSDHWSHRSHIPDYSNIESGLQKLFEAGHFDDVIKLGKKLFSRGMEQIGQSNDEGETIDEIGHSLEIVYKALIYCSLSDVDKMEQAVDWELADDCGLCEGLEPFWKIDFDAKAWSDLADRLLGRLKEIHPAARELELPHQYKRDKLTDHIIAALDHAGRKEELLQLCIWEAPLTASYERLVKILKKSGKNMEAEKWIKTGIRATCNKLPGIAAGLRKQLLEIHTAKQDWFFCAAIKADEFFEDPSVRTYTQLKTSCEKIKVWDEIRPSCIQFLNNGQRPARSDWPLPETGIAPRERSSRGLFPCTEVLIEIALLEKELDEALRLFDKDRQNKKVPMPWRFGWGAGLSDQIADAVQDKYPERAIAIWQIMAENHIAQKNPKEYAIALGYLKKIMKVMKKTGQENEFNTYITAVRAQHIRKYRFIEMLDALTGKRIVEE